ncbi:ABC transporter permease [Aureimonas phyllosphaerae]|uniref:ABC transporter permease n=1 Tax=Aureimonas phyllosphaerae TaxID=1166078 RepID=UPI003A5C53DB
MRRTLILFVSLLAAALLLFVLLRLLPGDPANALVGVGATPDQVAAARAEVGSDQPLATQFARYLADLSRLDFGTSFVSRADVSQEISDRLSVTLPLTLAGFLIALLLAVPLGVLSALRADRPSGAAISVVSQLGVAVPVFWVGILLVTLFAVNLRWLPSGSFPRRGWSDFGGALQAMVLPALTIGLVMGASLLRYVRAATQGVLEADYLRTARAMGAGRREALLRHGVRNGAIPVISVLGIELASTFLGAVVVERVFSLPGLGSMLLLAIQQRDYPSVQGVLFVSTLLVLLVGFAADLTQRLLDPRLRDRATS